MSTTIQVIAWIAVIIHLSGYFFQALKTLRSKNITGLSLHTFAMNFIGSFFWFCYGLVVRSFQVGFVNSFVLTAIIIILYHFLIWHKVSKVKSIMLVIVLTIIVLTLTTLVIIDHLVKRFIYLDNDFVKIIIGIAAGAFTSSAFLPQLIKIIKYKVTKNLSAILLAFYGISQFMWGVYWILRSFEMSIGDWITGFIFAVTTTILQFSILGCKLYFESKNKRQLTN